jgi:hypothetical protein
MAGINYFKNHEQLKILAFDRISIHTLVFFVIWIYQPVLTDLGVPVVYFGFIHAAMMGSEIVFMNNFDILEKAFKSKRGIWYGVH